MFDQLPKEKSPKVKWCNGEKSLFSYALIGTDYINPLLLYRITFLYILFLLVKQLSEFSPYLNSNQKGPDIKGPSASEGKKNYLQL